MRTLVVLGGSSDQLFMIRTAQEMGLRVHVFDWNPDCPGFDMADDHSVVSTRDVPALKLYLDNMSRAGVDIAGVTTMGSDIPDIVAALTSHLNLPGVSVASAQLATDKYAMKERFRERGVPIPWFQEINSAADLRGIIDQRGYDLVIKPVDRSGSRGVFLLDDKCDIDELFSAAQGDSFSGRVQVEEYLTGLQISTETVMVGGRGVTPGFADRNYEMLDRFRPQIMENGGWVPSILSADDRRAVERVVVEASLALDITDGITKGDVVMTDEGPKIIEIAARLSGGDFCESLVPLGSGVNYVRTAIELAVGDKPDIGALAPKWDKAVANRYFFPPTGILQRIEGAAEVRAKDWVHKLEFWIEPGEQVPEITSHVSRAGVFVITAPDRATAADRIAWVYDTIKIMVH